MPTDDIKRGFNAPNRIVILHGTLYQYSVVGQPTAVFLIPVGSQAVGMQIGWCTPHPLPLGPYPRRAPKRTSSRLHAAAQHHPSHTVRQAVGTQHLWKSCGPTTQCAGVAGGLPLREVLEWPSTAGGGGGVPPPPPDQSDHRGKKRNLPFGKSDRAIFVTHIFGSQTPPPPLLILPCPPPPPIPSHFNSMVTTRHLCTPPFRFRAPTLGPIFTKR